MANTITISDQQITEWANRLLQAQDDGEIEFGHTAKEWERAIEIAFADLVNVLDVDLIDSLFGPHPILDVNPKHLCDMPGCYRERPWDELLCKLCQMVEDEHLNDIPTGDVMA